MLINDKYERAILEAHHIVSTSDTIRETAKVFGVSKSTVYLDVTKHLIELNNFDLAMRVRKVLDKNLQERPIRGGMATKKKYSKKI